jgi:hypothetical protein
MFKSPIAVFEGTKKKNAETVRIDSKIFEIRAEYLQITQLGGFLLYQIYF